MAGVRMGAALRQIHGLFEAGTAADLTLRLVKDDVPIEGRVVDLEGKPVRGATIRPVVLSASRGEDLAAWESAMAKAKDLSGGR